MGALHALMQIVLFSITGCTSINPAYEITSPVFDEVIIHLNSDYYSGRTFRIKAYSNSSKNCYIQKAKLNGVCYNSFVIPHEKLVQGGVLELWLGDTPNKSWGIVK